MAEGVTQDAMEGGALSALRLPHNGDSHRLRFLGLRFLEFQQREALLHARRPFRTVAWDGGILQGRGAFTSPFWMHGALSQCATCHTLTVPIFAPKSISTVVLPANGAENS